MAKAGDKSTPEWMPLREVVECAGSFDALRPRVQEGHIPWRAERFYTLDGPPLRGMKDGRGAPAWWGTAHDPDPATGSVRFTVRGETFAPLLSPYYSQDPRTTKLGFRVGVVGNPDWMAPGASNENALAAILGPGATAPGMASGGSFFVVLAIGVELGHAAVGALWPAKAAARMPMAPMQWLANAYKDHPRKQNEQIFDWADRLHAEMLKADVTKVWPAGTLRRRLYDLFRPQRGAVRGR